MLRFPVLLLLLVSTHQSFSQYYYTDLISAEQSDKQYKALRGSQVKRMSAQSFENDNQAAPGFSLTQTMNDDFSQIVTKTSNPATGASVTRSSYNRSKIQQSTDSSMQVVTVTSYVYQPDSKIASITAVTRDAGRGYRSEEVHLWQYQANGKPSQMLKIKDKTDTTVVSFTLDEQGNVAEERWSRRGRRTETYYYYYNAKKQLTDVVRYSIKVKRLLPDYLFEYDASGRVVQMTQIPAGSSNYLVWKYEFSEQGLRQRELCYNKQQQLVGRIEYKYSF